MSEPSDEYLADLRQHRKFLAARVHENATQLDTIIITLAGGAFVVSVAFVTDITKNPSHRWVLVVGWALLLVSVMAVAASYWTAQRSLRRSVDDIDSWTADPKRSAAGPEVRETHATARLANTGLICLIGGLVTVGIFAAINFL